MVLGDSYEECPRYQDNSNYIAYRDLYFFTSIRNNCEICWYLGISSLNGSIGKIEEKNVFFCTNIFFCEMDFR